jgi:phosphinothricin acetyltransferase
MQIRLANLADVPRIAEIYHEAVVTTTATFDERPKSMDEMTAWFTMHDDRHPITVAIDDQLVVGWGALTAYSDRCAYRNTAEISFYVNQDHHGRGIGRKLNEDLVERAQQLGFRSLIARVSQGNEISLHLLRDFDYRHVGTLRQVGEKFGQLLDVHILQKLLITT